MAEDGLLRSLARYIARHHLALLALFIALGGTSYAAFSLPKNSVGSAQIRPGAVEKYHLAKPTIAALKGNSGPRGAVGPAGATGPAGPTGSTGPAGSAIAYAHVANAVLDTARSKNVVSMTIKPDLGTPVYCFVLSVTPVNAVATGEKEAAQFGLSSPIGATVSGSPGMSVLPCAPGTSAAVIYGNTSFFVAFN